MESPCQHHTVLIVEALQILDGGLFLTYFYPPVGIFYQTRFIQIIFTPPGKKPAILLPGVLDDAEQRRATAKSQ
jgi:hypothetical protein